MSDPAGESIWRPSTERLRSANLTRFRERLEGRVAAIDASPGVAAALHPWSVDHPASFWSAVWDFTGVIASTHASEVVDDARRMPGARWFRGARLNFAENLLAERRGASRDAIVAWNEDGRARSLDWSELRRQVELFAAALRRVGVSPGDRVAAFIPNVPEAVVAMLATSSLGAIWSSCSPDFGTDGVLDRFGPIEPKVLVAASGALWAGRWNDGLVRTREIAARLPSLEAVVVADYGAAGAVGAADITIPKAVTWDDFVDDGDGGPLAFAQLPFDHPLYVLYSSGTTGPPKGIVHGQGGTLLQHLKELVLHSDVHPGDRILYHTTTGWMMWNWMASALAAGATVVLYDGSPLHPTPGRMWDIAEAERLTHFGTGARYLAVAEKRDVRPVDTHDLSSLRTILSPGSPLAPESFDWVYGRVKEDVHVASISRGTDIVSCFVLGDPTAPVYRGEIQTAGLGMRVEVWDDEGRELPMGEKGELVCTRAFPSMPVGFWNDQDGARHRAAYFEHFGRAVWRHGDWIERTEHGGFVVHGRSDATLNPGGVRIGTAEIYRQVERFREVADSVVVGQRWEGDERIVLFVAMREGVTLDDGLRARIRTAIRERVSPRHAPALILAVPEIPRTVNGKVSEIAVRRVIHGQSVENADALANPAALEHFRDLPALAAEVGQGSPR
jgi:acetoacetyl-CoA synthetase